MVRTGIPMGWAQTRQRGILYACMSGAATAVVLVGFLVPLLKSLYVAGNTKHMFQPMFIGLANLAATAIGTVWWVPGMPDWWAHAALPNTQQLADPSNRYWVAWLGVAFIGGMFWRLSRRNFQTMRIAKQLAHEEHLKQGRLGPQKAVPPQSFVTVNARDIHESAIGISGEANVSMHSAHNNLAEIAELVRLMYAHLDELTPSQLMQVEGHLRVAREQLVARTPNHPLLRSSIQHIVEIGTAHALVGHWREILHALQRIIGS